MPIPANKMKATVLNAKDFPSRDALEKYIESNFNKTTAPKDVTIDGTDAELLTLNLSHGDSVWGINAVSKDYKPQVNLPKVERGERYPSKLNGIPV